MLHGSYNEGVKKEYSKEDISGLTFLGFVGFIDEIRHTSKDAIRKCIKAGIRVIMMTGDKPLTANAIAKELGLIEEDIVIATGDEIEQAYNTSKYNLISLLRENNVFARVSPTQKSMIIEVLQEQGEFIAVTGDGINDIPAMKRANIGVAMRSGADATKDASNIVLKDSNFLSIVHTVEEGRHVYNNIRKAFYLILSTALAEVLLCIFSIIFNLPIPFLTIQILWINLVINGISAFVKDKEDVMEEKPNDTKGNFLDMILIRKILVSGIIIFLMVFILWYILSVRMKMPVNQARNYILLLMVLIQCIHMYIYRKGKIINKKV